MSRKLSQDIRVIFAEADGTITMRQILDRIELKGFGILLVVLALPSALPLPAPGYSTPFGIALVVLALQMLLDRHTPWFPERVLNRPIKTKKDSKILDYMVRFVAFFERFIRPRLSVVYGSHWCRRLLGGVVLACGISMVIPVPLTNTTPALGVFFIGLGSLEEDGLIGIAGIFVAAAGLILSATVLGLILYFSFWAVGTGAEMDIAGVVEMVKDFIKGIFGAS